MINKLFYIILACFFIVACNNNKIERPKKPDNLIKKDEMVNILYDMAIITAAKGTQIRIMEKHGAVPENLIFKKYEIDSMQFVLSNEYYSYDIDTYEEIYQEVKKRLTSVKTIEDSLIKKENEERRKEINKNRTRISTKDSTSIEIAIDSINLSSRLENPSVNLILFSEKISEWYKYFSGSGIEPLVIDNEGIGPDGKASMSSVLLDLGGGKTRSDRSLIGVRDIPISTNDYVYSFWVKAKNPSDVGKTIRIIPEIKGGVEKIYTLTNKLERINVLNKIQVEERSTFSFIIEIRGEVTNSDTVEFYLWGVQFEQSSKVGAYMSTWQEKYN